MKKWKKVTLKFLNLSKLTLQHNSKFYKKLFSWATLKKLNKLLENIMEKGRRNTVRNLATEWSSVNGKPINRETTYICIFSKKVVLTQKIGYYERMSCNHGL